MTLSGSQRGRAFGALMVGGLLVLAACSGGTDSQARSDSPPASTCVDETQGGIEVPCPEVSETAGSQGPREPQTVESLSTGKSAYLMRCVGCHGADGSGIVGPDIRPGKVIKKYSSSEAMEDVVRDGLGEMPEFGSKLTDVEIAAVVTYVRGGLG